MINPTRMDIFKIFANFKRCTKVFLAKKEKKIDAINFFPG